jgi:signal transduction histidine kinase/PAS domain-containing protein
MTQRSREGASSSASVVPIRRGNVAEGATPEGAGEGSAPAPASRHVDEIRQRLVGMPLPGDSDTVFEGEVPGEWQLELLRALLEQSGEGVLVVDAHGRLRVANPEVQRQLGSPVVSGTHPGLTLGLRTLEGRELSVEESPLFKAIRGERVTRGEWVVRRSDGSSRILTGSAMPLKRSDGSAVGAVLLTRDETDRRRAEIERAGILAREQAAREQAEMLATQMANQQRWLEQLLDLSPTPLLLVEPQSARVMFSNRSADRLAGGSFPKYREATEYHSVYYCTDAKGEPIPDDLMPGVRAARGERIDGFEMDWHTPLGKTSLVVHSAQLPAMFGHPSVILLSYQDVSRLKETEHQLQHAVRARDEFLSTASHELKTPLTSLQLQTQQLRKMGTDSRQDVPAQAWGPKLETVARQSQRLGKLIDNLLDISRISEGRLDLEIEDVDLGIIARDTLARFEESLVEAQCSLSFKSDPGVVGQWDRLRLEQILNNLMSNAVKYGRGKPVEVNVSRRGDSAELRVRDRGIGISPGDQQRIFQRFERAVSGKHYGGLGLGLWIVRQIAVGLGGDIVVNSETGVGSEFILTLPLRQTRP